MTQKAGESVGAVLTLNAGSSSLKFSIYPGGADSACLLRGQVERIGEAARLSIADSSGGEELVSLDAPDHGAALAAILSYISPRFDANQIKGVGHRIVHGGLEFAAPTRLDPDVVEKLRTLNPLAPLHQPHNLAGVEAAKGAFPDAPQIGCFDTAFHRGHPFVNDVFALPRRFYDQGVRRYGFHGLSYEYVTGELRNLAPEIADGRVVIAHLGNGASMCAVKAGRSIGSTMGFSALDGLPMGTRCGQLDPGALLYLMQAEGLSADEVATLLYKESGLKGLSGLSGDMRTLESSDAPEARQAIDYYVFRIRRELGAMAAILEGIDALVFCGGIGENSAHIRERVCEGMAWLGVAADPDQNRRGSRDIGSGPARVLVIPTDEEQVIARAVRRALSPPTDA